MKKLFIIGVVVMALTGCNKQLTDTTFKFDYAVIQMPGGYEVEGKVESWRDFEDGDQLQIKINGVAYLTSANNVLLMAK